ncbi:MAG: hypothetical protein PHC92_06600 [Syntrophomonadaceae bacterium]|nr:hypothetical protein [Syntrophomonadaceae bacterium]
MMYVLASSRPGFEDVIERLVRDTGDKFAYVSRKEELTLKNLQELLPRYIFFPTGIILFLPKYMIIMNV